MVGFYGDVVRFLYDEFIVFIFECDGVCILFNMYMEFLQWVFDFIVFIFKIGSIFFVVMFYDVLE